ncbi:MAG: ATP synthase subunit I [Lachnospiraceae bacterium]|nr:ATP synthase subunit I [Lachnospiraceae bacterium]
MNDINKDTIVKQQEEEVLSSESLLNDLDDSEPVPSGPGEVPSEGKLSAALRKELKNVIIYVLIGLVILFGVVFLLMQIFPEMKETPDFAYWRVALGGAGGGSIAVLNFFLMGLTVQKVASDTNPDRARNRLKLSYTYRYLMQIAWIVIAILVPCFNYITGIVPLLFPSLGIKLASIIFKKY